MSGLTTVARALNANDQCLARIAAVHLRIPDLPDRDARDTMERTDVLLKYARHAGGGDSNWNPAQHPRTGTPPNPGWFAPTGGSSESFSGRTAQNDDPTPRSDASPSSNDDWVRLRPGPKRIDELADFIEWIANAKPEDAPGITAEIDRYFKDVGWEAAAKDMKNMLAVLTRPGITKEDRQQYLNRLELYTRVDPKEYLESLDSRRPSHLRAAFRQLRVRQGPPKRRPARRARQLKREPLKPLQPTPLRKFGNMAGPGEGAKFMIDSAMARYIRTSRSLTTSHPAASQQVTNLLI